MSHAPRGDNPYTKGVAAFVAGLTYGRIPAEVIARLKLLILDSLGCALYARTAVSRHSDGDARRAR